MQLGHCLIKRALIIIANWLQLQSEDLVAYGLIPEFVGRLPILVSLSALNEDQLVQFSQSLRVHWVNSTRNCFA
ncbi:unnamed protein product [Arabidopsis halleri]